MSSEKTPPAPDSLGSSPPPSELEKGDPAASDGMTAEHSASMDSEKTEPRRESQSSSQSPTELEKGGSDAPNGMLAHHSVPEGSPRGWMVVLGAMLVNACAFGYSTSFGVYQAYYKLNQLRDHSESDIAWIGSLQVCFMFAGGFIGGPLFDRHGSRVLMIPGSVCFSLSILLTSICTKYWHFILCQGIFGGIANGFIFSPSISAIGHYFAAKRGIAMGLVACGSSIGGVIFPIVLDRAFYSHVGFGWGVRAVGFVILFLLLVACVLVKERLPPRKGRLLAPEAFAQPSYAFVVAGVFCLLWAVFTIYFFISAYALAEIHVNTSLAFYLLSIMNALSLCGRLFFGAMADKLGTLNALVFVSMANGVLVFCWTLTSTSGGLIGWSVVFGFFSGGVFSLFPASIGYITPKPQLIGTYMGQAMAVFALAGLSGGPIAGAIVSRHGFFDASIFGGVAFLAGMLSLACARHARQSDWTVKA